MKASYVIKILKLLRTLWRTIHVYVRNTKSNEKEVSMVETKVSQFHSKIRVKQHKEKKVDSIPLSEVKTHDKEVPK